MSLMLLSAGSLPVAWTLPTQAYAPNITVTNATTAMYQLSSDSEFAFILSEYLSLANEGGAASGEILRAAAVIEAGDFESWYKEFTFLAEKIGAQAEKAEKNKALVSAREAYFRSSSYYRAADFFLHGNQSDPRIYTVWDKQKVAFNKAVGLLSRPGTFVELKADGFTVPAYFYPANPQLPANQGAPKRRLPTVIVGTGYDGSQQAIYHSNCLEIIERGWNCITYEGPGQPTVRRDQDMGFIPEWWEVVTPVVDYARARHDVDIDKVALMGVSYGGLLAPLAATKERRLAAVVALDGMLSLKRAVLTLLGTQITELYSSGNETEFNNYMTAALAQDVPTSFRWLIEQGMWSFNTTDPYTFISRMGDIYLDKEKLDKIECPVFVGSGEDDNLAPVQPEEMARLLGPERSHYFLFKTELGAGEHSGLGGEQQIALESLIWLDKVFEK
ncbi:Alpha/Beta hydrolase protein [Penicillium nucicola]|uniref:Alpha/Beta hydrolase protein n=1 Tax=Penicillium nucicola TaxID=1850975 RepID=UPI002544F534|nr:Alpha/Beta hydrolase protein [Penicillium nucicola]KAJ5775818.1 Alpha/Beta hydrolase protein [Penicillium nucicola]